MVLLENDGILPLKDVRTLAAYGNGVRYTVKGGIGSGDVNSRTVVNAEQGLNDAGFILTSTRWLERFDTMCTEARETYNAEVRRRMAEDRMAGIRMILESPYQNPDVLRTRSGGRRLSRPCLRFRKLLSPPCPEVYSLSLSSGSPEIPTDP